MKMPGKANDLKRVATHNKMVTYLPMVSVEKK